MRGRSSRAVPGGTHEPTGRFSTDIPARLDRMRWWRFHTLLVAALGTSWIIDGLEVTLVGALASTLTLPTTLGLTAAQVGEAAGWYVAGAVHRRDRVRWTRRPVRSAQALLRHARSLRGGHRRLGLRARLPRVRGAAVPHRCGDRRRIRGDQLRDPGIHARAPARTHRSRDQRQLLDRRRGRRCRRRDRARLGAVPARLGLAHRLHRRRRARARHPPVAPLRARRVRAGCCCSAGTTRPSASSPTSRRRHAAVRDAQPHPTIVLDPGGRIGWFALFARAAATVSAARHPRPEPDERAGVPLQRDLLHLCTGADPLLRRERSARRACSCCRSPPATFSGRCCSDRCSIASAGGS